MDGLKLTGDIAMFSRSVFSCTALFAIFLGISVSSLATEPKAKKILLVPTKYDHPWASHMYPDVCRILAECLRMTSGVEAVVSPEFDWPSDPKVIDSADAIVYYSRPAGDIILSPKHREHSERCFKRGVGFVAIHWATAAELDAGPRYEEMLGGWFNFAFCGLKVDTRPLEQIEPTHPLCRGWKTYDLRDEFYLKMKFHPKAKPILQVDVDGAKQTVAWVIERDDGGRSVGTTLGHFHDNFERAEFRKMIVNGILWAAKVDVPVDGADVNIAPARLKLDDSPKPSN